MVEGIRDLATINLLTWRQEMNSLNKRMGELRNSTGEHGVWSRVYTGKIENGSKYDNDYQTYQVGYDKKYTVDNGVMFVGGLVSYTDGETRLCFRTWRKLFSRYRNLCKHGLTMTDSLQM